MYRPSVAMASMSRSRRDCADRQKCEESAQPQLMKKYIPPALSLFSDHILACRMVPTNRTSCLRGEVVTKSSASRNSFTVLFRSRM